MGDVDRQDAKDAKKKERKKEKKKERHGPQIDADDRR